MMFSFCVALFFFSGNNKLKKNEEKEMPSIDGRRKMRTGSIRRVCVCVCVLVCVSVCVLVCAFVRQYRFNCPQRCAMQSPEAVHLGAVAT